MLDSIVDRLAVSSDSSRHLDFSTWRDNEQEFDVAVAEKITYTSTPEQVESMHSAFDSALDEIRGELGQTYPMIIGGEERPGAGTFEVRSPADHDLLLGRFA